MPNVILANFDGGVVASAEDLTVLLAEDVTSPNLSFLFRIFSSSSTFDKLDDTTWPNLSARFFNTSTSA